MCRAGGMCAAQEVFCGVCAAQEVIMFRVGGLCGVCAAQEVIMFRVGGLCGVCAAAGLYLWATVQNSTFSCRRFDGYMAAQIWFPFVSPLRSGEGI